MSGTDDFEFGVAGLGAFMTNGDAYLERLDAKIRRAAGEVWADEGARDSFVFGLMTARATYTSDNPPGVPYRSLLAEVLGPDFERPPHAAGCVGHRHGRGGCVHRGCGCLLGITRLPGGPRD